MDVGRCVLLLLALLTALNWAVHYYTQTVTYRLFPVVADASGGAGFVRYHRAYEARLPWSVYLPWALLTLTSVAFVLVRPAGLGATAPVVLLVLNASIEIRQAWTDITDAEFDAMANRLAHGLLKLGIAPGDRVKVFEPNAVKAA